MSTPKVYAAMVGVMEDIGKEGIAKRNKNQAQGYSFRGIDDVYNELNGLLTKHRLLMLPSVVRDEQVERTTTKGGIVYFTRLVVDFKLVCADDGSSETIRTVGEAMDSGDKSANKAQSAAYKYAAMQVFCIPTEGDNDADAATHHVAANSDRGGRKSSAQAKRDGDDAKIKADIQACDKTGLLDWHTNFESYTANIPISWLSSVRDMLENRLIELNGAENVSEAAGEMDEGFRGAVEVRSAMPRSVADSDRDVAA